MQNISLIHDLPTFKAGTGQTYLAAEGTRDMPAKISTLLAILLVGCTQTGTADFAEKGANEFHRKFAEQRFSVIYETASPALKKTVSREEFISLLSKVYDTLGPLEISSEKAWKTNSGPYGPSVAIAYATHFKNGDAIETFEFLRQAGGSSLLSYHIQSPLLQPPAP